MKQWDELICLVEHKIGNGATTPNSGINVLINKFMMLLKMGFL